jgi:acyl-CoA thioester hydrolase
VPWAKRTAHGADAEKAVTRETTKPVLFFSPFVSSTMRIEPQWIDYNGHLNMAWYHVLFDRAVDEAFAQAGLGPDYLEARGMSTFAAECHILYKREIRMDDRVRITLQLVSFDEKRLHFYMEMRHAGEGWVAAASENLALHVDMKTRKVTPFPPDILANLAIMQAAHGQMKRPALVGRVIGLSNKAKERHMADANGEAAPTRH